jgi:O-antigen ligase
VTLRLEPARLMMAAGSACAGLMLGLLAGFDPALAILGAVAAAYVLLTFASLSAGLALFVFLSFLEALSVSGAAAGLTKLLGLVLALSWLALVATRTDERADLLSAHPIALYGLLLFVGWSTLSILWAEDSAEALSVSFRFLLDAVLYVVVYTAVRDRRAAQLTIAAFVAGAIGAAVYGLIATPALPGGSDRLTSALLDPNQLAAVLVAGIVLSLGLANAWKSEPIAAGGAIAAAGFCVVALFLTVSRGGLVALVAVAAAAILFTGRWRWFAMVLALSIAIGGYLYFTTLAPSDARERLTVVSRGEEAEQESRLTIWTVGWRTFEANAIGGVGAGNFPNAAVKYVVRPGEARRSDRLISRPSVVHNSYLHVLAELGLVGGALFGALIAFSLGAALRAAQLFRKLRDHPMEALSRALLIAMVGILVADFFISEQAGKQLWLVLGLGPAFLGIARRAQPAET